MQESLELWKVGDMSGVGSEEKRDGTKEQASLRLFSQRTDYGGGPCPAP